MVDTLTQDDINDLSDLVSAGNYTQFYYSLYQSGSTISGLYIPGPSGQGIFGNYSHEYVSDVIGHELFDQDRAQISNTIANELLDAIIDTRAADGTYRILTDEEFLTREIYAFTNVLGYPAEAYPGHDLIDWTNINVDGAIDQWLVMNPDRWLRLLQASYNSEGETHYFYDGKWLTVGELRDIPNSGINIIGAFIYGSDGKQLQNSNGIFEYKGERIAASELIERDGVLFANTDKFGLVPVGLTFGAVVKLVDQVGGDNCFLAETLISLPDGDMKAIKDICVGDEVLSYDSKGQVVSAYVTRVFKKHAKHILDVFGLMVTPGHVTLCGDGQFAGTHVPIIDILRSDGALVREDGSLVRATTGIVMGEVNDRHIWAVTGDITAEGFRITQAKQIRLGMRFLVGDGKDFSVAELIAANGGEVTPDGLVRIAGGEPAPFHWSLSPEIPNSEDYVLQRSCLTLAEIYQAGEWEGVTPALAVPVLSDIGPVTRANGRHREAMRPNIPLALREEHRTGVVGNRSFTPVAANDLKLRHRKQP